MDLYIDTNKSLKKIYEGDLNKLVFLRSTYVKHGIYKYVYKRILQNKDVVYEATIAKFKWSKYFINERDAAIAVDKKFLEHNCNPVNILVPKR